MSGLISTTVADVSRIRRPNARRRSVSATTTLTLAAFLTIAALVLWLIGFAMLASIVQEIFFPQVDHNEYHQFLFRDDGLPVWQTTDSQKGVEASEYHGLDGQPVEMTLTSVHRQMVTVVDSRQWRQPKRLRAASRVTLLGHSRRGNVTELIYFRNDGERGYFELVGGPGGHLRRFVSLAGFTTERPDRSEWFATRAGDRHHEVVSLSNPYDYRVGSVGLPRTHEGYMLFASTSTFQTALVEADGRRVFAFDFDRSQSLLIHDGEPVFAASFAGPTNADEPLQVVLRLSDSLKVVPLVNELLANHQHDAPASGLPSDGSATSSKDNLPGSKQASETTDHSLARRAGVGEATLIPIPESLRQVGALQWLRTKTGHTFVTLLDRGWRLTQVDPEFHEVGSFDVEDRNDDADRPDPIGLTAGVVASQSPCLADFWAWVVTHERSFGRNIDLRRAERLGLTWPQGREITLSELAWPLGLLHLSTVVWPVLAVRRLRRFSATRGEQCFWGLWTWLFGAPGYLAFRAHREWSTIPLGEREGVSPPTTLAADSSIVASIGRGADASPIAEAGHRLSTRLDRWTEAIEAFSFAAFSRLGLAPGHAALMAKEVRLSAGVAVVGCIAHLCVIAKLMSIAGFGWVANFIDPRVQTAIPFLSDKYFEPFTTIGLLMAVWLAVWQTSSESRGEAWLFLLHRPVSRRAVLLSKLLVGLSVLLGCSAWPIVAYGGWAATRGTHASIFEWSMTDSMWRLWWSLPPLYLGTLLTMLRPARWFGTRLFPCIAGFLWLIFSERLGAWLWPTWQVFAVVAVIDAVLIASLLLVVREREYP